MRIQHIRLKNLNSLRGEWHVDLTGPAYEQDGIFAITGPTGAGKSTILDAVCLALYGRTPRLEKVNKGGNEIMSRRTGECWAEVEFESGGRRYRCRWSQQRARKKADGELQPPKHEVSDAARPALDEQGRSNLLASKITEVGALVTQITGLNFERFTRSMLLAQGGFAAFLDAQPELRANLLEQITGTEVYSDISQAAHQRMTAEKDKLGLAEARLEGLKPLSAEEEAETRGELGALETAAAARTQQTEAYTAALAWLDKLDAARAEWTAAQERAAAADAAQAAFAPRREQLAAAGRALELEGVWASVETARKAQAANAAALAEQTKALPALDAAEQAARQAAQQAAQAKETAAQAEAAAAPAVALARELDTRLAEQKGPLADAEAQAAARQAALTQAQHKEAEHVQAVRQARAAADAAQRALADTAADAGLTADLAGLRAQIYTVHVLDEEKNAALRAQHAARTQLDAAEKAWRARQSIAAAAQQAEAAGAAACADRRAALAALLGGRSAAAWSADAAGQADKARAADAALTALAARTKALCAAETARQRAAALDEEARQLAAADAEQRQLLDALRQQCAALEENLLLRETIASLEEHRAHLQEGRPCPLCGALAHPYAAGKVPAPEETRTALAQARQQRDETAARVQAQAVRLAEVRGAQAGAAEDVRRLTAEAIAAGQTALEQGRLAGALAAGADVSRDEHAFNKLAAQDAEAAAQADSACGNRGLAQETAVSAVSRGAEGSVPEGGSAMDGAAVPFRTEQAAHSRNGKSKTGGVPFRTEQALTALAADACCDDAQALSALAAEGRPVTGGHTEEALTMLSACLPAVLTAAQEAAATARRTVVQAEAESRALEAESSALESARAALTAAEQAEQEAARMQTAASASLRHAEDDAARAGTRLAEALTVLRAALLPYADASAPNLDATAATLHGFVPDSEDAVLNLDAPHGDTFVSGLPVTSNAAGSMRSAAAPALDVAALAALEKNLIARQETRVRWEQRAADAEQTLTLLEHATASFQAQREAAEQDSKAARAAHAALLAAHTRVREERAALLDGQAAAAVESALCAARVTAEKACTMAEQRLSAAAEAARAGRRRCEDVQAALRRQAQELAELSQIFAEKLAEQGFAAQEAFMAARLDSAARQALRQEQHRLDTAQADSAARVADRASCLSALLGAVPPLARADGAGASLFAEQEGARRKVTEGTVPFAAGQAGGQCASSACAVPSLWAEQGAGADSAAPRSPNRELSLLTGMPLVSGQAGGDAASAAEAMDTNAAGAASMAHLLAAQETALRPRAELDAALAALREEEEAALRRAGALRQKLEDSARVANSRRGALAELEAQRKECRRWQQLHALIGSHDGKRFRNFAQGLTFAVMVGHANSQLRRLNDRYLLAYDPEKPLELEVADLYQAGLRRSTKNLSGGESFIVSLALALGLARMAGRQVRLDTLFLDEGFGTLDEDALDTALTALAALHEDGKLIGVISHVAALKERIAARVQVEPRSGGVSRISGPGCSGGES